MISLTDKCRIGMSLEGDESRNSRTVSTLVLHSFLLCGPICPQTGDTAVDGPELPDFSLQSAKEKDSSPSPPVWKPHRELAYLGSVICPNPGQSSCSTETQLECVPTPVGLLPDVLVVGKGRVLGR